MYLSVLYIPRKNKFQVFFCNFYKIQNCVDRSRLFIREFEAQTTLHYAPCNGMTKDGVSKDGFRVIIVLPKDTNTAKPDIKPKNLEDKLLWARNKWLIAHPDSSEAKAGAFVGLTGVNIDISR